MKLLAIKEISCKINSGSNEESRINDKLRVGFYQKSNAKLQDNLFFFEFGVRYETETLRGVIAVKTFGSKLSEFPLPLSDTMFVVKALFGKPKR